MDVLYKFMIMANETPADRVIDGLARKMASVARDLAEVGLAADMAVARHDWDSICAASERLLDLQRSWAALYRRLLVASIRPCEIAEPAPCRCSLRNAPQIGTTLNNAAPL